MPHSPAARRQRAGLGGSASTSSLPSHAPRRPATTTSHSAAFLSAKMSAHGLEPSSLTAPTWLVAPRQSKVWRPMSAAATAGAGCSPSGGANMSKCRREIFALSQLQLLSDDPESTTRAAPLEPPPEPDSTLHGWRRRGTEAWLANDLTGASEAFGKALAEGGWPLPERLDMARLRVAALLRLKRNSDALCDARAAAGMLSAASSGSVPAETAQELWYLLGVSLLATGLATNAAAAAEAAGRAMVTQPTRGPKFDQLCDLFLKAAASAPEAAVPIEAYVTADQSSASQDPILPTGAPARQPLPWPAVAAYPPTYRLVLRPKFAPWPLALTPSPAVGSTKLCFFCAHRGTPAAMSEPHTAMVCTGAGAGAEALVMLDVRADGTMEVLANSASEARRLVDACVAPRVVSTDFQVLSDGWRRDGRPAEAFALLVQHEWRLRRDERVRAARERQEAAGRKQRRAAEMVSWLGTLDLDALAPLLLKEGLDLESLPLLHEPDLERMGVADLGDRRKLMGACRARSQYLALEEAVAGLQAEKLVLQKANDAEHAARLCAVQEASEARDTAGGLAAELRAERERREALEDAMAAQAVELEEERAAAQKWLKQARALAADVEAVQAQLHSFTDSQRASVQDSKDGLRLGLANLLDGVRQPDDAAPSRRLGVGGKRGGGSISLRSMVSGVGGGRRTTTLDEAFSSNNVSFTHKSSI